MFLSLVGVVMVTGSYWHPKQVPYVGDFIKSPIDEITFCNKSICVVDASRMGQWMNETANPCDNFYRYACGSMLHYVSESLVKVSYDNELEVCSKR